MAANEERSERSEPVIHVGGTGIASIAPDLAAVTLGIQLSGPELAPIQAEARQAIQAITEALKAAGVEPRRIHTANYNIHPTRDQSGTVGYEIWHMLEARFSELERAGEIIDRAIAAGANTVQAVRFMVEDASAARRLARERAMSEARARAEHLASLAGLRVGPPIYISEGVSVGPPHPMAARRLHSIESASMVVSTAIDPGESDIVVTVEVIYPILATAD